MGVNDTKTIIDVSTGEVKIGDENAILRAFAIGSCVVVSAYNLEKKIGAMVHVMLFGKSLTDNSDNKTRQEGSLYSQYTNK